MDVKLEKERKKKEKKKKETNVEREGGQMSNFLS